VSVFESIAKIAVAFYRLSRTFGAAPAEKQLRARVKCWGAVPSFRDGPKDQTSDVQCTSGNLEIPGSMLRIAPE